MVSFTAKAWSLALVIAVTGAGARQQVAELKPGEPPPGFIEIDGSKSPESIPDWTAWQSTLRLLADASANPTSQFYVELGLTDAERARVVETALAQNDRDQACEQRMMALGQRLAGVDEAQVLSLSQQEQIRCRVAVLDAADALVASLSPASARRLRALVDEMRASTRVMVPRDGLAHFRRPR